MKKIFYLSALLAFAMIANQLSAQCPNYTPWPPVTGVGCQYEKPCGLYIIYRTENALSHYQDYASYYDGIFIKVRWDQLEDSPGNLNLAHAGLIEDAINFAVLNGKQVSIGIMAGSWTPHSPNNINYPYMNTANAFFLVNEISKFGNGDLKTHNIVPFPWDDDFQSYFTVMIYAFHSWLSGTPSIDGDPLLSHVNMIKLTGVNSDYEETRTLIEDESFSDGTTCADNVVSLWSQPPASYYPDKLINDGWLPLADFIQSVFNDKWVNLVVLRDPKAFPPVDCNGVPLDENYPVECPATIGSAGPFSCFVGTHYEAFDGSYHKNIYDHMNLCSYNVTQEIMRRATSATWAPCLAINSTSLAPYDPNDPGSIYPLDEFPIVSSLALIGFQQRNPNSFWSDQEFAEMISNGYNHYASFIEIFESNFRHYTVNHPTYPDEAGCIWTNVMEWAHCKMLRRCREQGQCELPCDNHRVQNPLSFSSDNNVVNINSAIADLYHYNINDIAGRVIKEGDLTLHEGENSLGLRQFNLNPGVYVFTMTPQKGGTYSYKLVIK